MSTIEERVAALEAIVKGTQAIVSIRHASTQRDVDIMLARVTESITRLEGRIRLGLIIATLVIIIAGAGLQRFLPVASAAVVGH